MLLNYIFQPGGSIFFTTINKTALSYALGIIAAEQILRLVSPGTHDWNKFISPLDVQYILEKSKHFTQFSLNIFPFIFDYISAWWFSYFHNN